MLYLVIPVINGEITGNAVVFSAFSSVLLFLSDNSECVIYEIHIDDEIVEEINL